ncbi:hypothetical protein [Planctomicrobium sp. SH527]|uniref:hypothetical protein n=1 Tax=Planctomicrobium sp. SH527 TaxID=3448123 RepID=UPI003F5C452E
MFACQNHRFSWIQSSAVRVPQKFAPLAERRQAFSALSWAPCLLALALSLLATNQVAFGQSRTNIAPAIEEVIRRHESTWNTLSSIDMTYDVNSKLIENGVKQWEQRSSGNIWRTQDDSFRLLLSNISGDGKVIDRFVSHGVEKRLVYPFGLDFTAVPLSECDSRPVRGFIGPAKGTASQVPQNLKSIYLASADAGVTLRDIVDHWTIEVIKDEITSGDGERLTLRATIPESSPQRHHGTNITLTINKDKGYLIESAIAIEHGVARKANSEDYVPVNATWKVAAWTELPNETFYPSHVSFRNHGAVDSENSEDGYFIDWIATSLRLGSSDGDLGFSFPEHTLVHETLKNGDSGRIFIWATTGEPLKTFSNESEYETYRRAECKGTSDMR